MAAAPQIPVDELLAAGLSLFPVQKCDKPPRDEGWRTKDYSVEELKAWVAEGGNLGVRLQPGDAVEDWDVRGDIIGDSLERLHRDGGQDPAKHFTVRTPSRGLHVYLTVPKDARVRGNLNRFGYPGVDLKKSGGYVLAPGCVHPDYLDGPLYTIEGPAPMAARPMASEKLLALISKPTETLEERARKTAQVSRATEGGQLSPKYLRLLLAKLDPENFRSYEDWSEILRAVHHGTAGSPDGLLAFTEWSVRAEGYEHAAESIEQHWESYRADEDGGTTVATLFHHVLDSSGSIPAQPAEEVFSALDPEDIERNQKEYEAERAATPESLETDRNGKALPTFDNARIYMDRLGLVPRYDQLRDTIVVNDTRGVLAANGWDRLQLQLSDALVLAIVAICGHQQFAVRKETVRDVLIAQGHRNAFNPLTDWLETLKWDGKPRLDLWLHRYMGAEDTPLHAAFGRLTLMGAVARAYQPGIKFDTATIWEGAQGLGKSKAIQELGHPFVHEGLPAGELRSKDVVDSLRGAWLVELDELDALRRADVTALKSFLSRTTDRARLAYRITTEDFPRRCIFIGTTNEADYLMDATGARRFWPVRVGVTGPIQAEALGRDRDQLFAEARALWMENPTAGALVLDQSLWADAAAQTVERTVDDPWLSSLQRAFQGDKWKSATFISTDEVLQLVLGKEPSHQNSPDARRIAGLMRSLGWSPHRVKNRTSVNFGVRGWKRELPLHTEEPKL